jgi:hypothetical protein
MTNDRGSLLKAFDGLPIAWVDGPDVHGRVRLELTGEGFIDLGAAGGLAADAALEWRSRRIARRPGRQAA